MGRDYFGLFWAFFLCDCLWFVWRLPSTFCLSRSFLLFITIFVRKAKSLSWKLKWSISLGPIRFWPWPRPFILTEGMVEVTIFFFFLLITCLDHGIWFHASNPREKEAWLLFLFLFLFFSNLHQETYSLCLHPLLLKTWPPFHPDVISSLQPPRQCLQFIFLFIHI